MSAVFLVASAFGTACCAGTSGTGVSAVLVVASAFGTACGSACVSGAVAVVLSAVCCSAFPAELRRFFAAGGVLPRSGVVAWADLRTLLG